MGNTNTVPTEQKSKKEHKRRYQLSRSQILGFGSIAVLLGLFIALALADVGWSYAEIDKKVFYTNFAILILIAVYAFPTGLSMTIQHFISKLDSALNKARDTFFMWLKKISDRNMNIYLQEYCDVYFAKKLETYCRNLAINSGIRQIEVLQLEREEIVELGQHSLEKQWKDGRPATFFLKLTENQVNVLLDIVDGNIDIERFNASYYTNELSTGDMDEEEKAKRAEEFKKNNTAISFAGKISLSIVIAFIFAGLIFEMIDKTNPEAVLKAWVNLIERLFMLMSALYSGSTTASTNIKADIYVFEYKSGFLEKFFQAFDSERFTPVDISKKAREEFLAEKERQRIEAQTLAKLNKDASTPITMTDEEAAEFRLKRAAEASAKQVNI